MTETQLRKAPAGADGESRPAPPSHPADEGEDPSPPDVRAGEPHERHAQPPGAPEHAAGPTTVREVESKLRVHGLFRMPELVSAASGVARVRRQAQRELHAIYHDTDDLRLIRWGVTLRRREGGEDAGWHLKLPVAGAGGGVRDEVRVPLEEGAVGMVPATLLDVILPLVRNAKVAPVAQLRTERVPYLLYDADGVAFAELVDDTVSVIDSGEVVSRFRELEVEALVEDAPLAAVVDVLIAAGGEPGTASKAASALGPATHQPPDVPEPGHVSPGDPAAAAVTAHLRKHVRAFLLQDVRVRRDLPDAIHQMRVAARRLRSGLKVFAPLVDAQWSQHLRDELGWAAGELGVARDTEVMLQRLDQHADELDPDDAVMIRTVIDPRLRNRLATARDRALTSLHSDRHVALLNELVEAARQPNLTARADEHCRHALPPLVEKAYQRLGRDVKRLRLDGPAEEWHQTRIAAKRARYAAEAVAPVFGHPAQRLAAHLSEVTEVLGEHQDACVAQDVIREMAASRGIDGSTGFALGLLHEHEFEAELHARIEFQEIWPEVRRAHRRHKLG